MSISIFKSGKTREEELGKKREDGILKLRNIFGDFSFFTSSSSRVYSDLNMEMEMETPKERGRHREVHYTTDRLGSKQCDSNAVTVLTQRRTVTAEGLHCVGTGSLHRRSSLYTRQKSKWIFFQQQAVSALGALRNSFLGIVRRAVSQP